jgi:hypothetical protein
MGRRAKEVISFLFFSNGCYLRYSEKQFTAHNEWYWLVDIKKFLSNYTPEEGSITQNDICIILRAIFQSHKNSKYTKAK